MDRLATLELKLGIHPEIGDTISLGGLSWLRFDGFDQDGTAILTVLDEDPRGKVVI